LPLNDDVEDAVSHWLAITGCAKACSHSIHFMIINCKRS